ncbi:tyrosine-type recombinase/integrase [Methylobacterium komagatae]
MADSDPILGLIVTTDASCKIKGQSWTGIPTLVWPEGIDDAASDWFRTLVIESGVTLSSAREYAKILRPFLRFCRQRGRPWQSVDDEFLILWREHLRRAEGVSIARANASLKTIFAFFQWAEENKRIRFQVGIYPADELPLAIADITFPISAKRSFTKGRHGRVYGSWTTPLTLSEPNRGSRLRHTPTEGEIRNLHEITVEREHGERDSLMFSWAEEAGPRRAEFLRLGRSHLPTNDQLADVIERDEPWPIAIPRKGGKETPIYAPPDLIIRTLDYIQYGRRDIVERCLSVIVGYREPDEIFLSGTTGQALHVDSVTAIGRRMFRKAGITGANVHRLRARYAVNIVESLVEVVATGSDTVGPGSASTETILTKAAEMMSHTSPQSLRPYLTYVLNRRIQTADATKAHRLASRLRQMQHLEGTFIRRLKHHHDLQSAANQLQAGRGADAASTLRRIADEINQSR